VVVRQGGTFVFKNIFNRSKPKERPVKATTVAEPEKAEEPGPGAKKPKSAIAMVPIFSWRTALVALIGLVLGVTIALVYWILSPSLSSSATSVSTNQGSGLLGLLGIEPGGPYNSNIRIQVVSPGSEYIPLKNLQQMGEYYGAKASSLPFFEYLSQELVHQMPGYSYDVDELSQMITAEYDYNSEIPIIKITVNANSEAEAVGLAGLVPQDFRDFLVSEEQAQAQKSYANTVTEIESVKTALYEAQQEFDTLQMNDVLNENPSYLSLKAKVDSLQQLLDTQATQIASQVANNIDINTQYDAKIQQISSVNDKLKKAQAELEALGQNGSDGSISDEAMIVTLNAKIRALQAELDKYMIGYTTTDGNVQTQVTGLAELIASGDTKSPAYIALQEKVNVVSLALANAQKELEAIQKQSTQTSYTTDLDYQIAQIKVDTLTAQLSALMLEAGQLYQQVLNAEQGDTIDPQTAFERTSTALAEAKQDLQDLEQQLGYDRLAADLDYKIAEDKVTNLNLRLSTLTAQLGTLTGSEEASEADYLVAGNPTTPTPVLPMRGRARNTLLIGAIAGIVIAWGILNFRWIAKGMPSSKPPAKNEGDSEN
jgi:hypothetical protein